MPTIVNQSTVQNLCQAQSTGTTPLHKQFLSLLNVNLGHTITKLQYLDSPILHGLYEALNDLYLYSIP